MNVLVVGGTRFIGRATVELLLSSGHQITMVNRGNRANPWPQRVREFVADRRDPAALEPLGAEEFDAVVDFCAYTAPDTQALLEALGHVQRLVHISSGTVYRLDPHLPWNEQTPYGPARVFGAYAQGKIECEETLRRTRSSGEATTVIRFPWVLGARSYADRERFVLNRILDRAEVLLPGDGQAVVQFLSVGQAAEAIDAVLQRFDDGGWRAFNIASPGFTSLQGFVEICGAVAGIAPRVRAIGGGATGTGDEIFDMQDCVFPFPNLNYVLDLRASEAAGVAPAPVDLEDMLTETMVELQEEAARRVWRRTPVERGVLSRGR